MSVLYVRDKSGNRIPIPAIQGPPGANGEPGATPYIGANGNWYIGTTDTGIKATGPKGEKGDQGDTGAAGKTPVKGTDYWTTADQTSIVQQVIDALPDASEVSY